MKKSRINIGFAGLLLALFTLCGTQLKAVQLPTIIQRIYTDPITLVPVNVGASSSVNVTPSSGSYFTDVSVVNAIEFGYDVNYPRTVSYTGICTVDVLLTPYDMYGVVIGTPFTHTFTINYDPTATTPVQDKDVYKIVNAWKVDFKITAINGLTTGTLPANMYVEARMDIDRVYDFISVLSSGPVINSANAIDIDGVTGADEIEVNWSALQGTDEYQLEWTFVNDYNTTLLGTPIPLSSLAFDFKNNSTRITTTALTYRIPLLFDRGWVLFRLRAIGRDMTHPTEYYTSSWNNTTPDNGADASVVTWSVPVTAHENNKNWQVTTTFAEEGKKKEVISYFDGSLRNRQTLTRINSDENVIVGETVYDYQGRPAVNILPTPVEKPGTYEAALHYYPFFNKSDVYTTNPYNRKDFDEDVSSTCDINANALNTVSGASNYYSDQNTDMSEQQAFVPDAKKYPFTQVEYTPDNTGRIRRQGGVGVDFQLDSGHETKYFYGQPNQLQLDRMFGTEVGDAAHYKKNMVIDPNGQVSVSYLDQEGRVVATALAGNAPVSLDSLAYDSTSVLLVDLFEADANGHSNLNTPNLTNDAIEFSSQLMVPFAGYYQFNYDFNVTAYTDSCLNENICFSCVYDLTLSITDECGNDYVQYGTPPGPVQSMAVGHFDTDGSGNIIFKTDCADNPYTFSPAYSQSIYLGVGTYTVSKILKVDDAAVDFYVGQYLDSVNNHCFKTLYDFEQEYLAKVDTTTCYIDCADCITNLGDRDDFVSKGLGTALQYDVLYEKCLKSCKTVPSLCETSYNMMLADVSPQGQYGQYMTSDDVVDPSAFLLSVLNTENHLPQNLTSSGTITHNATWRKPVTTLNGNTYNHYINEDGTIARVNIFFDGTTYSPAIAVGAPVLTDGTQQYTYPEYLANVQDFVAIFKPEWAKGIVYAHPEYCYYQKCKEYGVEQGSATFTSDDYDMYMETAVTYQQALTGAGGAPGGGIFIDGGTGVPFDPSAVSTSNIYDPFLDPANSSVYGSASTDFMTKWNQYLNISGTWYNMFQVAAMTVRCGNLYGLVPPVTCDDFGQPIVGLTPAEMTEILDREWGTYRGFYMALKNEIQQNLADQYALTSCYGINDCIGNDDDFNPGSSGMFDYGTWSSSPYLNAQQPCGYFTHWLYADKKTRFPDAEVIPGLESTPQEAGYQQYILTGQCPKTWAIEGVLNEMAGDHNLDILTEPLLYHESYNTFYLVDNNYAPAVPITTNPLTWTQMSMTTDYLQVHWIDLSSSAKLKLELDKTGSGIANWDDISSLTNLQSNPGGPGSYTYPFNITAHVDSLDTCIVIHGSITYDIQNCIFPEHCTPNQFAKDLQLLMSSLAATAQLTSSHITLNPTYNLVTSNGIKTRLGVSTSTSLDWSFDNITNTWSLFPSGSTPPQLDFKIISYVPTTFSLTNLSLIKSFTHVNSAYMNYFTIEGRDASNNVLVTLTCSAKLTDASSVVTPVSMGECGLPTPILCQSDPYVITHDLHDILLEAFTNGFNGGNIDLLSLSSMTTIVASHLGVSSTSSLYTTVGSRISHTETLNFVIDGCDLNITLTSPNPAATLNSVAILGPVIATGPTGVDNYYHAFYTVATFIDGTTDTIRGTTCLPLANCYPCADSTWLGNNIDFPTGGHASETGVGGVGGGGHGSRSRMLAADSKTIFEKDAGEKDSGDIGVIKSDSGGMSEKDCNDVYTNYVSLITNYNSSLYSAGTGVTLPLIYPDLASFYAAGKCDCYSSYAAYLKPYLVKPANLSLPHPFSIAEFPCNGLEDSCTATFNNYQSLINTFNASDFSSATGCKLPKNLFANAGIFTAYGYCNCYNQYAEFLEPYLVTPADPTLPCPAPITSFSCDTICDSVYLAYQALIGHYNKSDYASETGYILPLVFDDATSFTAAGLCHCFPLYETYLEDYLVSPPNLTLPPPVTIDLFGPCEKVQDTLPQDTCDILYTLYVDGVNAYNTFALDNDLPGIGYIYDIKDMGAEGYCYCVTGYLAFLQSVIQGDYGRDYVYSHLDWLDIGQYCSGRLTAPCTPQFNNFSMCNSSRKLPSIPYTNPCVEQLIQNALENAEQAYNEYVQELTTQFADAYRQHCLGAIEHFTAQYTDKEYHYTLYYYDQPGNLVKTIPPAGVHLLSFDADHDGIQEYNDPLEIQIMQNRASNTHTIFTFHSLATTYEYNSLNQLVKQNMPDHDQMDVWETTLPNGLNSKMTITKIQYVNTSKGFLTGYVGNRGLLYTTNDAGANWTQVYDVVAADIHKISMPSGTVGYAAANDGVLLQTINGGSSWDMMNTYGSNINWNLYDVYFALPDSGVVVGDTTVSIKITNATTTPVFTIGSAFPNSTYNATNGGYFYVTAVTRNNAIYIASARHKVDNTTPEVGRMYWSYKGLTWNEYTEFNAPDLNKISFYASSKLVSGGNAGTFDHLENITLSAPVYSDRISGATGKVKDVYYINANEGVAIIEEIPGQAGIYSTTDAGQTWELVNDPGQNWQRFEFYSSVGTLHKLIAVGDNGLSGRVIINTSVTPTAFGIILLNNVSGSPNLKASWAAVDGSNIPAFVGGNSGSLFYTTNAGATTVSWSASVGSIPSGENVKRIAATNFGSGVSMVISGVVLTHTGKLYGLFRNTSGTITTTAITVSGANFTDIRYYAPHVFAYDNTNKKVYKIKLTGLGISTSATALTNSTSPGTPDVNSIDVMGTYLVAVGKLGATWRGIINSVLSPTSITWTDITNKQIPLGFTDVRYSGSSGNKTFATTLNGNIYVNVSGSPTRWQQMEVASTADLNAFYPEGAATKGAIAADNGKAYAGNIFGNTVNLTELDPLQINPQRLNDVIINGTTAVFVGDAGRVLTVTNYSFSPVPNDYAAGSKDLSGIQITPFTSQYFIGGRFSRIYQSSTCVTFTSINTVFTPELYSVHFINPNEGYLVGNKYTARYTFDGGNTWNVVKEPGIWAYTPTTLPKLLGVCMHTAGRATFVGDHSFVSEATGGIHQPIAALFSNTTFYDVGFSSDQQHGYIVGGNTSNITRLAYTSNGGTTWTGLSTYTGTGTLKGVYVFDRNNCFMAVGTNNTILYGDNTGTKPGASLVSPPTSATSVFNDIDFVDDIHGYVVGDGNVLLKSDNTTTLYTSGANTGHYATGAWNSVSPSDGLLNQNTANGTFNINAIAMSSFTTGTLGGWFNDNPALPIVDHYYARNLTDESGLYSTKFWYDRLGRIVVSQNTRQFGASPKKYSYSTYDALGRVIEAGEKDENTTATAKFSSIFGAMVNGLYNPNTIDDTQLNTWITDNTGNRTQVTHTYYDRVYPAFAGLLPVTFAQENLRKRVATVTYEDLFDNDSTTYEHATHYSYDIHGNVNTLLQDNQRIATNAPDGLNLPGEEFKRVDYDYDLISGKVNQVDYQDGQPDQWHHRYTYDADNRVVQTETSTDDLLWDKDARYTYYAHGPLARTELGHDKIQGYDFAYTLQGWIKGVNSNSLVAHNDMGQDAVVGSTNPNTLFAKDVNGYTLNYFDNDYAAIDPTKWTNVGDRFEADKTGSDFLASTNPLFNGNIRAMVTTITDPSTGNVLPMGMAYRYDQLNRLKNTKGYDNLDINQSSGTFNSWGSGSTYSNKYYNAFTYDPNGNILTQKRHNDAGTAIEDLTYQYNVQNGRLIQNRLYHVNETVTATAFADDIDDMGTFDGNPNTINVNNNYRYDAEGRLVQDLQEEIAQIVWRVDGKVKSVLRTIGSTRKNLEFDYDATGNRVAKHVFNSTTLAHEKSTYYVRDAQGNVLAVYEKAIDVSTSMSSHKLIERDIYGSARVGLNTKTVEMIGVPPVSTTLYTHELGLKQFELSNHLGNVLTVVSDKKRPVDDGKYDSNSDGVNDLSSPISTTPDGLVDYYTADIVSATDYYPFGIGMNGRSFQAPSYRYGLNGQGKIDEMQGDGNTYSFEYRIYDTRLGRFMSVDPLQKRYPFYTPYQFAGNQPIVAKDLEGLEPEWMIDKQGRLTEPLIAVLNAAFGFKKSNLRNTQYHADKWTDSYLITIFQDVYYDPDDASESPGWWFNRISHEQTHRSEVGDNIFQGLGWYLFYSISSYSLLLEGEDAYFDNPGEIRAYSLDKIADQLWSYHGYILTKILASSDYSESAKSNAAAYVGYHFAIEQGNKALNSIEGEIKDKQSKLSSTGLSKQDARKLNKDVKRLQKTEEKIQKKLNQLQIDIKKVDNAETQNILNKEGF